MAKLKTRCGMKTVMLGQRCQDYIGSVRCENDAEGMEGFMAACRPCHERTEAAMKSINLPWLPFRPLVWRSDLHTRNSYAVITEGRETEVLP